MNRRPLALTALLALLLAASAPGVTLTINTTTRYQTIDGFGAFMSIAPWKLKQGPFYVDVNLDALAYYDTLVSQLGLTIVRIFPDADYSTAAGTWAITAGMRSDLTNMRKLREAAARQAEPLDFVASVLSPPGYMKPSNSVAGLVEGAPDYNSTDCRLRDGYDAQFAEFCVRHMQLARDSAGVNVSAFNIQNEPAFQEPYPSCVYNGTRYTSVSAAVGQAFANAGLSTKLFGAEHMSWAFPNVFETYVRASTAARGYFCAWAVHGYQDGVRADTGAYQGETPTDKPLWMSETSGATYGATTGGLNDWAGGMALGRHILGFLRDARISAWIWYTLMSNSGQGDASNTYGLIADGRFTDKAWVSQQFYRFIRPGSRQVASTSDDGQVSVVAFRHEQNNCLAIVLINNATADRTVTAISGAGLPASYEKVTTSATLKAARSTVSATSQIVLPASSITTLVSGSYRGTSPVAVTRPAASAPRALARSTAGAARTYGLDGRLVDASACAAGMRCAVVVDQHGRTALTRATFSVR